mgnify:CR=1 FL=1
MKKYGAIIMENVTYKSVLKLKNYRRLLFANVINRLGDAIDTLAFSWIVYAVTGEGTWAAIVFGVNKVSSVVFLPLAGAFVEKKNKKAVMMVMDIIRCILVAGLVLSMTLGQLSVVILLVFSFLISMAEAFRIPAGTAFITQTLTEETLDKGVTLNVMVSTLVEIGGAAIGGLLLNFGGAQAALLVDVGSFLLSLLLIGTICQKENIETDLREASVVRIFKDGLRYIKTRKVLVTVILLAVLANASMATIDALQAPIVVEIFRQDVGYLSILNVALSTGLLLGGGFYPTLRKRISDYKLYIVSFVSIGLLYAIVALYGFGTQQSIALTVIPVLLYFLYGVTASFLIAGLGLQLFENVEQSYMARVSTVYSSIASLATPTVSFLSGIIVGKTGMPILFMVIAVCILGVTVLFGKIRKI